MTNIDLTDTQKQRLEELMDPASNWPSDLRDLFDVRCNEVGGFQPDLDREVASEYVKKKFE